jgi:2-(1,2-epoxy-1,2-dihydrophenyl)acetyl-CoA isomerase
MGEGITVDVLDNGVAVVEFSRPPVNYFDVGMISGILHAYAELDRDPRCRAIVLASPGKHFCVGADFGGAELGATQGPELYELAAGLCEFSRPVVVAVQGQAIGGGLGLALTGDFRVAALPTRFVCNFAALGLHHGFGLSATLPETIGRQRALELLYKGSSVEGLRALEIGLCDRLVDGDVRDGGISFAAEIAAVGPLAVQSIRRTMRGHLPEAIRRATAIELKEQLKLFDTADFREGVLAARERRPAVFTAS